MSTPTERTRSLIWAGGFLVQISRDTSLPVEVRQRAAAIARHFPTTSAIAELARLCNGDPSGLAELSPDILEEWSQELLHGALTDLTRVATPFD